MSNLLNVKVNEFMAKIIAKNPGESEFHQAVQEVVESLMPFIDENPKYKHARILERIAEPERTIIFRVPWVDDNGEIHINRGYRIEMNSAIGPYKGGLRFHPTVNLGILNSLLLNRCSRTV
jgi:glutamate dehydrogenase/leucine dehydrogenase